MIGRFIVAYLKLVAFIFATMFAFAIVAALVKGVTG